MEENPKFKTAPPRGASVLSLGILDLEFVSDLEFGAWNFRATRQWLPL